MIGGVGGSKGSSPLDKTQIGNQISTPEALLNQAGQRLSKEADLSPVKGYIQPTSAEIPQALTKEILPQLGRIFDRLSQNG